MSCGIGHRHGSDLVLLWLWCRLVALIRPLAWEPPYAWGAALKSKKTNKINNKKINIPAFTHLITHVMMKGSKKKMSVLDVVTVLKENKASQRMESDEGSGEGSWLR